MQWAKQKNGFTIVELLIVIVVITILAAITIVSYNGIQNRANDTAIKSDLKSLATKLGASQATSASSEYPNSTESPLAALEFKVSQQAYWTGGDNLLYCGGPGIPTIGIVAISRSGKAFAFKNGTIIDYSATSLAGYTSICVDLIGANSPYFGYKDGVWRGWTK